MDTIHVIQDGAVLCGFSRRAPAGVLWTPVRNLANATCEACKKVAGNILNSRGARPFADEGDWQKRESEQQRLVEEILSSLAHLTADDESYAGVYGGIAQLVIWHITDRDGNVRNNPIHAPTDIERIRALRLYVQEVDVPIRDFVGPGNEEERRYLLGLLLDKLIPTIRSPSSNAYSAKMPLGR